MGALAEHLAHLRRAELDLAAAFRAVADAHRDEADVFHLCGKLAGDCDGHAERLAPFAEPAASIPGAPEIAGADLLADLQDLYVLAARCDVGWMLAGQAARGARDDELLEVATACEPETAMQMRWLRTRLKQAAPQSLLVS